LVFKLIITVDHDGVEEAKDKNNLIPAGTSAPYGSEGINLTQKRSVMELASVRSQLNALLNFTTYIPVVHLDNAGF
jgi:hypothetical protein